MSNTYENHMDNLPITSWEIMGHPTVKVMSRDRAMAIYLVQ